MSQWSEAGDPGLWTDQRVSAKRKQSQVLQNVGFVGTHAEIGSGCSHGHVCQSDTHSTEAQALECWQGAEMTSEEEGVWVGRGLSTQAVSRTEEVPGALRSRLEGQ